MRGLQWPLRLRVQPSQMLKGLKGLKGATSAADVAAAAAVVVVLAAKAPPRKRVEPRSKAPMPTRQKTPNSMKRLPRQPYRLRAPSPRLPQRR